MNLDSDRNKGPELRELPTGPFRASEGRSIVACAGSATQAPRAFSQTAPNSVAGHKAAGHHMFSSESQPSEWSAERVQAPEGSFRESRDWVLTLRAHPVGIPFKVDRALPSSWCCEWELCWESLAPSLAPKNYMTEGQVPNSDEHINCKAV